MIGKEDIHKAKVKRNIILIVFAIALGMIALLMFRGGITGYYALDTFESETVVTGSSAEMSLNFRQIPNFVATAGDDVSFRVVPNKEEVQFSDDTALFNITQEGKVEFTPSAEDAGKHNIWIIIKDDAGHYYYQNVIIIIEE